MMLQLNFEEVRQLTGNMIAMRKEYKKVFKQRYKDRKTELLNYYDNILKQTSEWVLEVENSLHAVVDRQHELVLNKNEAELLISVLKSYLEKLDKLQQQTNKKIDGMETLRSIQQRLDSSYTLFYQTA